MATVYVMVVVNVSQAVASGNLGAYVYMADTTGFSGSGQGGNELITTVTDGSTIIWSVVPIDPATSVSIVNFTGQAIPGLIKPVEYAQYNDTVWGGQVLSLGTHVQYSMTLLLNGADQLTFDPFITSNPPQ
ncbi:MAG: hypothetical protein WAO71_04930 [Gallionella sp.]